MTPNILIVDDEISICTFLSIALEDEFSIFTANTPEQAFKVLREQKIHLVLLDLLIGESNGLDVMREIMARQKDISVIMMTAYGDIHTSVEAIKLGAFHYLCKPINMDELLVNIRQALEFQHLSRRVESLSKELVELEQRAFYGDIIGKSEPMQRVYHLIDKLKDVDSSVIITGESGTGKELVARAIHRNGNRHAENFITVNCAAIPEGLLEEEFFGHIKGSFTGATSNKRGKLEFADHGTLFLDEVGDMPLSLQGKLLRVLQEREVMPIGGSAHKKIDIRVICATNRDLFSKIQEGSFRQDLYYRLHVVEIPMPTLRERKQDIPDLCKSILSRLSKETGKPLATCTSGAERLLLKYNYPGNVRELINVLEYAFILCAKDRIDVDDLPDVVKTGEISPNGVISAEKAVQLYLGGMSIKDVEKLLIKEAIREHPQSRRAVAKELGISERSLFYKIQEYDL